MLAPNGYKYEAFPYTFEGESGFSLAITLPDGEEVLVAGGKKLRIWGSQKEALAFGEAWVSKQPPMQTKDAGSL